MIKMPMIIGNIASSLDGKIAPFDRSQLAISNEEDFKLRDLIRAAVDGVLVGGTTLCNDQPSLLIKDDKLVERRIKNGMNAQPAGIALCGITMPEKNNRFFQIKDSKRILICGKLAETDYSNCQIIKSGQERPDICEAMRNLYENGIASVMVEGGGTIMFEFLALGLMKEFYLSVHPVIIGGANSPTIFDGQGFLKERIPKINIVQTYALNDGGIILHCIVDGAISETSFIDDLRKAD